MEPHFLILFVGWPCSLGVVLKAARRSCSVRGKAGGVKTTQQSTSGFRFELSQIRRHHVCLAVTCHLHFWQNDICFGFAVIRWLDVCLAVTCHLHFWQNDIGLGFAATFVGCMGF